jgi:hypothetical protein
VCNCPELYTENRGWQPVCEAVLPGRIGASLRDAAAEGPDPRSWRCPKCQGAIVRGFWERTPPGQVSAFVDDIEEDDAVRAGYRCRTAICGWRDWVMWIGVEV